MARVTEYGQVLERFPSLKGLVDLCTGHLEIVEVAESRGRVIATISNGNTGFRINYPASEFVG